MKKIIMLVLCMCMLLPAMRGAEAADEKFSGLWHSMNMVAAGFDKRFAFYGDGTFIYGCSQMDNLERNWYKTGKWAVADGELRLTVETRVLLEGGQIVENDDDEQYIEGGTVREYSFSPPESEIYKITQTGQDPESERETISIDGETYYRFDNQIDLLHDYYEVRGIEPPGIEN